MDPSPAPSARAALLSDVQALATRMRASMDPSLDREAALDLLDGLKALLEPHGERPSRVGCVDLTTAQQPRQRSGRGHRAGF